MGVQRSTTKHIPGFNTHYIDYPEMKLKMNTVNCHRGVPLVVVYWVQLVQTLHSVNCHRGAPLVVVYWVQLVQTLHSVNCHRGAPPGGGFLGSAGSDPSPPSNKQQFL